jgi:hypothetical protein
MKRMNPILLCLLGVVVTCGITLPTAWGQENVRLSIRSDTKSAHQGQVVTVTVTATVDGKPAQSLMLVPYVNGKRWGTPNITDKDGKARFGIPLWNKDTARINIDAAITGRSLPDQWIWDSITQDEQTLYFQRSVGLDTKPKSARLWVAADNKAEVFVNGVRVGVVDGWGSLRPWEIAANLQAGRENVLSIKAINSGGPGSLAVRLETQQGGKREVIVSDRNWKLWRTPPANWPKRAAGGSPAKELGTVDRYMITPKHWPGLEGKEKLVDGSSLYPSSTVSNTLTLMVTPPTPKGALPPVTWDTYSDTWVATDGLGRSLPTFEEVGPPRKNKTVGIFYYLWHEFHSRLALTTNRRILDTTDFLRASPQNTPFVGGTYWWSEPIFGYYNSSDTYVLRKHAQMLSDAGVDTLVMDASNDLSYWEQWLEIGDLYTRIRQTGQKTPQISYLFWASTPTILPEMVNRYYKPGIHQDLWFQWKGKPLILADAPRIPATISGEVAQGFSLRTSWAWSHADGWFGDGKDRWPWLDNTPQKYGWHESPDKPEQVVVSAGHHASTNRGRSLLKDIEPPTADQRPALGLQFNEQWQHALKVDPEFLFITQWNEWIAGGYPAEKDGMAFDGRILKKGERFFIDEYNPEFSRDVEPMKGGFGDNYYYQMVANIRRYKGVRPILRVVSRPITVDGRFADWKNVCPEFRDTLDDAVQRDSWSWAWLRHYINHSGRNDIRSAKVSSDVKNLYFYVRTQQKLTSSKDKNWMTLYLDTDQNPKTGWLGYDVVINRAGAGVVEKNIGGAYTWQRVGKAALRAAGAEMELSVPCSLLNFKSGTFDFKWADNCILDSAKASGSDFTTNGDAAPNDRFNYRAKLLRNNSSK